VARVGTVVDREAVPRAAGLLLSAAVLIALTAWAWPGQGGAGCGPSVCGVLRYETVTLTETATKVVTETVPAGTWGLEAAYLLSRVPPPPWPVAPRVAVLEPSLATREVVEWLHSQGALVLGYVNAGYAEEWRSYWPSLVEEGVVHGPSGYEGEYLVEYWSPAWRRALLGEIQRLAAMGFDGVYLDNLDAATLLAEEQPRWLQGRDPRAEMARLVCWAKDAARSHGVPVVYGNIGVAVDMLYMGELLGCLDGVLREELWTPWPGDTLTPVETLEALDALSYAHSRGLTVVVADPAASPEDAERLCIRAWSRGWLPVPQPAWDPDYSMPPLSCNITQPGAP